MGEPGVASAANAAGRTRFFFPRMACLAFLVPLPHQVQARTGAFDRRGCDSRCDRGLTWCDSRHVRRGASVVGFDESPEMVRLARHRLARHRLGDAAEFRVQDLGQPIDWAGDGSFDLAVMALVIHHLDDRVGALREIHRILRPLGRLVISPHHPMADWRHHGGSYFDTEVIEETWQRGWQVRYWRLPLTQTCAEFAAAGFWIERLG
jgi:SAM-dependent methyltransferase